MLGQTEPVRAFLELAAALKGTIVVMLRRAHPRTLAVGGAVAALVLVGLVVALGGSVDGGSADLAGGQSGPRRDAPGEGGSEGADPELVAPDGRPLIDGVATRSTPGDSDRDGDGATAGTPDRAESTGGDDVVDDAAPMAGEPASSTVQDPASPRASTTTSTSTADPDSPTTTDGSTTTTTAEAGSSSGGGVLGGLLDLLGLG